MDNKELEQVIKTLLTNPITAKRKKVILTNGKKQEVIFETSKQTILNPAGMPEIEIVNASPVLGDGTSLSGAAFCETCNNTVSIKSLRRCKCGRTTCLRRGCGKIWGGRFFCSLKCVILSKFGLLRRF